MLTFTGTNVPCAVILPVPSAAPAGIVTTFENVPSPALVTVPRLVTVFAASLKLSAASSANCGYSRNFWMEAFPTS